MATYLPSELPGGQATELADPDLLVVQKQGENFLRRAPYSLFGGGGGGVTGDSGFVTPEEFGAVGDAVWNGTIFTGTDDTDAVQAAYDAHITRKKPLLLTKFYRIVGTIQMPSGGFIIGMGASGPWSAAGVGLCNGSSLGSTLTGTLYSAPMLFVGNPSVPNYVFPLTIQGVGILGAQEAVQNARCGIQVFRQQMFTLRDVNISGWRCGINADNWWDSYISNVRIASCGAGDGTHYAVRLDSSNSNSSNALHWHACTFENNDGYIYCNSPNSGSIGQFTNCKFEHGSDGSHLISTPALKFIRVNGAYFDTCTFHLNDYVGTQGFIANDRSNLHMNNCMFNCAESLMITAVQDGDSYAGGTHISNSRIASMPKTVPGIKLPKYSSFVGNVIQVTATSSTQIRMVNVGDYSNVASVRVITSGTPGTEASGGFNAFYATNLDGSNAQYTTFDGIDMSAAHQNVSIVRYPTPSSFNHASPAYRPAGWKYIDTLAANSIVNVNGRHRISLTNTTAMQIAEFRYGCVGQRIAIRREGAGALTIPHGSNIFTYSKTTITMIQYTWYWFECLLDGVWFQYTPNW